MEFENDYIKQRHLNRQKLEELGVDPYPGYVERTHSLAKVREDYDQFDKEQLAEKAVEVAVVGRIMLKRHMGKAAFMTIDDGTGACQVYVRLNDVGEDAFKVYKETDLADFIGVRGKMFRTRTNELTVHADSYTFLGKAYRGLPEKFHGLKDHETRYRQRYLDLLANPDVKDTFVKRSQIINQIRAFMTGRGYLEVETPMMHLIPGGASARPFITHHNALKMDLYLRIALELHLKRLIVGGIEKVFEINRNFRNEGLSSHHNPEFTMMEWYEAWGNLGTMKEQVESLIKHCIDTVVGDRILPYGQHTIDFNQPFASMTMREAACKFGNYTMEQLNDPEQLRVIGKQLHIDNAENMDLGYLLTEVFEAVAEPKLIQPTFITEYPVAVSPLTKRKPGVEGYVDRFELFIAGMEVANAYTELNDPVDQRERFEDQAKQREAGDEEAQYLDEDFLVSMEHGMPPTGGQGLGIDRLVMLLTNSQTIRDVILFPLMKPQD